VPLLYGASVPMAAATSVAFIGCALGFILMGIVAASRERSSYVRGYRKGRHQYRSGVNRG